MCTCMCMYTNKNLDENTIKNNNDFEDKLKKGIKLGLYVCHIRCAQWMY